jgi:alkylation response protein AidB-like acyl-CoA dehydrogenase
VLGGYRIFGRWDFASGIRHADWHTVAANGPDGGRLFLVPIADCEVVDTWHTSGLRGTGSHDVLIRDAFIPEPFSLLRGGLMDRRFTADDDVEEPSIFMRVPLVSLITCGVVASLIGMCRQAIDLFEERMRNVPGARSGIVGATRPEIQLRLAQSEQPPRCLVPASAPPYTEPRSMIFSA